MYLIELSTPLSSLLLKSQPKLVDLDSRSFSLTVLTCNGMTKNNVIDIAESQVKNIIKLTNLGVLTRS